MYSVCTTRTRLRSVVPSSRDVCSSRAPQEVDIGVVRVGGSRTIGRRGHGLFSSVAISFPILGRIGVVHVEHSNMPPCALRDRGRRVRDSQEGGLLI